MSSHCLVNITSLDFFPVIGKVESITGFSRLCHRLRLRPLVNGRVVMLIKQWTDWWQTVFNRLVLVLSASERYYLRLTWSLITHCLHIEELADDTRILMKQKLRLYTHHYDSF
uniref:Uncharacterized protein n=1 Tax=Rhipicephalus zambeziensis TaxID=60191 RepID=A0A224YG83_9ACAR